MLSDADLTSQFFLRGTQLTQLSDEYDLCYGNVTQTQKLLAVKREALPDLKARLCEATARYNEAEKAREQKKRADDLKKELAWSHVATKQEEMSNKMEETAKLARRLPKIEEGVKQAEVSSYFFLTFELNSMFDLECPRQC